MCFWNVDLRLAFDTYHLNSLLSITEDEDGQSDDEDIDFELDLPDILVNISLREKRELLEFKRTHNEVGAE
jgi:hypothetical protein